ncbi:MAG: tyrosine recombinase [Oscillospiraceae bacterium]|nr:tyrosine recombinase [Oscillospiraceae bacterium]
MTNHEVLSLFEKYLVEDKKASANTLSSYLRDVRQLAEFLKANTDSGIVDASPEDLASYISLLRAAGKSVATVSRTIASIKCLYAHLFIKQIITVNPAQGLTPEKSVQKLPEILTSREVELLLSQPNCIDPKGYRDKAMLELLYATGIRVTELIDLRISDINLEAGVIRCASAGRERLIPVYPAAVKALRDYITLVRPQMILSPGEQSLFVNLSGEHMSRQGFWKIIKHYQKMAGIEKDITPHTLRHSFAAHLLENGADIHAVRDMLGHRDISSMQVYSKLVDKQIKDVYNKAHPRA